MNANPGVDPSQPPNRSADLYPWAPTPGECPGGFLCDQGRDTFFSIARRFGITVSALIAANPNVDPDRLQIGQQICVPAPMPGPGFCPGGFIYTIRAGDTFFSLANRFNTTVQAIIDVNPGVDPNRLQIGQQICIPVPPPVECPNGTIYTIRAGDTLFALAQRFGTTVNAIILANPGIDPNSLKSTRICIPVSQLTGITETVLFHWDSRANLHVLY